MTNRDGTMRMQKAVALKHALTYLHQVDRLGIVVGDPTRHYGP
jgi:hypothetical protein